MNKLDMSIASLILGTILLVVGIMFNIADKVDFAIALLGVYFILAGLVANKKLKEFLRG